MTMSQQEILDYARAEVLPYIDYNRGTIEKMQDQIDRLQQANIKLIAILIKHNITTVQELDEI